MPRTKKNVKKQNENVKKENENTGNTTKKNRQLKALKNLSKDQMQQLCKMSANTFSRFEDEYQKTPAFIKKGMHTKSQVEKNLIKLINEGIKGTISPSDNYYGFINDVWIKDVKLSNEQKYIVQLDDFRLVQYKVYHELDDIIKDYIKHNKDPLSRELDNFYVSATSGIDNDLFEDYTKKYIIELDELRKEKSNIWKLLAFLNINEFTRTGCPFTCTINPDEKNSKIFSPHVNLVKLSLPDALVYVNDGTNMAYKNKIKARYFKYIREISNIEIHDKTINSKINPQDVFDIEYELLLNMGCDSIKKEAADHYNKITSSDALKYYNFDWSTFSKELGYSKPPPFFITSSLNYLKCTTEMLLKDWDTEKWRSYWIYLYKRQVSRVGSKIAPFFFNFFSKFLEGQTIDPAANITTISFFSLPFNSFLTNKYIEKNQKKEHLDYVANMAYDIGAVFKRTIRNNEWLSPKTKKKALLKLEKLYAIIGSSKVMSKDPILNYDRNDIWGNFQKIFEWRYNKLIEQNGKEIFDFPELDLMTSPPKFKGKQAYIVNAFYTPSENTIYIPQAYIQKPFVDLGERGIEYNLSHLGFTIAHEVSHCLDDWGSQYDENGNLNNWWTDRDRKIFKKKQDDVIAQYEAFALKDGIKFDARPSIGEDLADISGLAICEEYLRDFQDKNDDITPIRIVSFQAFFIYYAFQMRQKINKKAITAQLHTNPHPLDKYRTNVPLSRLELFRSMYKITKKDKMYWPSTDKIW